MKKYIFGIDLGTTFSSISVSLKGRIEVIANSKHQKCIPSIVNFISGQSNPTVGNINSNLYSKDILTVYDSKRMLGRKYDHFEIQKMKSKWPFKIEENENGYFTIQIKGHKKLEPYEISGEILKYMIEIGNKRLPPNQKTNEVVITIPANFGDDQRTETLKAAEYAQLKVLTMINEPTAAGIAYSILNDEKKDLHYVFVFDFGGGTIDVSLLEANNEQITVKSTNGNMFLGGRDFDEMTINYLIKKLKIEKILKDPIKMKKFRDSVVDAKIELSESESSLVVYDDKGYYDLTVDEFETINKDLIDKILDPVERIFETSEIEKNKIDSVLMVGGASNMRFVKKKLIEYFGIEPFYGFDPQEAVVTGAGIIAAKLANTEKLPKMINNLKYIDICPYSIGILVVDGTMEKFIQKGEHIPFEKSKSFHTIFYKQNSFRIDIFEGDDAKALNNHHIGNFSLKNLPESDNNISFNVCFTIDQNGILSAKACTDDKSAKTFINIDKIKSSKKLIFKVYNDYQIFYKNIFRFLKFNEESFVTTYGKSEYDKMLYEAKCDKANQDNVNNLRDCILYYREKRFKKYFTKYRNIPAFFNDI